MGRTIRRRRLEARTDYKARIELIKSGKPRLVVRKTNRYVIAQLVRSEGAQDFVVSTLSSKDLIAKGWPENKSGSLKNRSAAYLTGYLLGKAALGKKITEAILDAGMYRNIQKSRIYTVLKGALDAGLKVPHDAKVLPKEEFLHVSPEFKKIVEKIKN
ncbi:MAG: 50S ribosomal protein L18 [Nanoarchaeota archaeon]|nr:50S ribosomal protein L18 [Nanoarchaeota archaeon]